MQERGLFRRGLAGCRKHDGRARVYTSKDCEGRGQVGATLVPSCSRVWSRWQVQQGRVIQAMGTGA